MNRTNTFSNFRYVWTYVTAQIKTSKSGRSERPGLDPDVASLLASIAKLNSNDALEFLQTRLKGLTFEEARKRLFNAGRNVVAHETSIPWHERLLSNFKNPFIIVLLILGFVSFATGDSRAGTVVTAMVAVSVLMRFFQEYRSSRASEALQAMVRTTATVTRQQEVRQEHGGSFEYEMRMEVPFDEVVPGDIIHLAAGDMVPADVRLLSAKDLFISASALTGESMPVEKQAAPDLSSGIDQSPLDRSNLCFLGTNVVSGAATAAVISTGEKTFFGALAKNVVGKRALTSFDLGVNSVTWLLVRFMLAMVPIVFLINGFTKGDWQEAFLFAIAVAVGLTPEMLPMIVTANLAKGAVAMSKRKVIVKRLNAIQNLGAMDVLCTDKTGTLTQDKVILEEHFNIDDEDDPRVLKYAFLNSFYQTGLKNLLDRAVLEHFEIGHEMSVPADYEKIDEIPFDFSRRRMSVIVRKRDGSQMLICKGAVEEVLEISTHAEVAKQTVGLDKNLRANALQLTREKNTRGFRVVAVAYKKLHDEKSTFSVKDENDLTLMGFIGFLDPPKESAAEAIKRLIASGVEIKILTGDNDIVTKRVCSDVGIAVDRIFLGSELTNLSDSELDELVVRASVFAKLAPVQKASIVRALQRTGRTVGFLGDGINDAPALRDADVGISVDTATDIARESADIILLEKSLLVLEEGVIKGREVYGNIIKYIKMTASSNFGNVFSVLIASAFIPFMPMLPVQILVQNLLYDFSQTALPWDQMDAEFLKKPRRWDPKGIGRFMIFMGPVSSIFDILTFVMMWRLFGANSTDKQALFQSGWFVEGLISQTLVVHMIRTQKVPFFQSVASPAVLFTTGAIIALGAWMPFSAIGGSIGLVPLPAAYFPLTMVLLLTYCVLAQGVKVWYMRRFNAWL